MSNGPSLTDLLTSEALLSQKTLLKSGKSTTQDNNNNNNPSDSPSSTRAHRSISPLSDTSSSSTTSPPLNLDHSTPDVTQSPEPLNRGLENIKKQENKRYFKNRLSVALNELNSMSLEQMGARIQENKRYFKNRLSVALNELNSMSLEQMGARIQEMEDNDNEMTANASLSSHSSSSKHLSSSVSFDATANDDQTAGLTIKKSKSVDDSSDVQSSSLAGNKLRKSIIGVMARNQTKKRVMANVARALASYVPNLVITVPSFPRQTDPAPPPFFLSAHQLLCPLSPRRNT
eukprot:TRINITY_DN771_c0_g1_i5.p1 TRINITY_DN771_c0_g1~~TRINITY_DN771_c0_g1_i5.p1  ORF type:complete len:311 (-),score=44.70 TRINITY_DN771_c0_g1_i5:393-1259(-)